MESSAPDDLRRYLVFRIDASLFAWPADLVREVVDCPSLVRLPRSPQIIEGVGHHANRFLPIVDISSCVGTPQTKREWKHLVIVSDAYGAVGIGIDQGLAVKPLETSFRPEQQVRDGWSEVIAGTAGSDEGIIRIIDPETLFLVLRSHLESHWSRAGAEPASVTVST